MPAFSISRIGTYETCPLQYKFAYIDNIEVKAENTIEAFLGDIVHKSLEKLYRDKRYEKLLTLDELLNHYHKLWAEKWDDSILIVKEEYTQENYRKMGEKQITDYYARYYPFDSGRIIGLETKDLLPLDAEGNYKFHIRIDRLMNMGNGVYEVHDYKTGNTLPKQEELDRDRQLAMYSLWVRKQFKDFKGVRLVWHQTAFDKEMESFRTEEQLEELRDEILAEIKEIEAAEEYPANVSWLCDWCLYKSLCPMWKHGEELKTKSENEYLNDPGLKLVDEYVRIKGELDEHKKEAEGKLEKIKEALIAFCKERGESVVFGSGNKITLKEYESLKFPGKNTKEREELIEALAGIGKLGQVSDLDVYALAKALDNKDWDEKEIEALMKFGVREKGYRFSVSKK